jgi:two-component system, OmpR family, sensor histidine kinase KdpD
VYRPVYCGGVLMQTYLSGALKALVVVAVVAAMVELVRQYIPFEHPFIFFLLPVLISAIRWGTLPALVAAISGIGTSSYFLFPPFYSFQIKDLENIVNLISFVAVALVTSHLATSVKYQAEAARKKEDETRILYEFSRRLALARTGEDIRDAIRDHLSSVVKRKVLLIGMKASREGPPESVEEAPRSVRRRALEMASQADQTTRSETLEGEDGNLWLIRVTSRETRLLGAIAVNLGHRTADQDIDEITRQVDTALADAAATLERLDVGRAISEANIRSETELLRDALLGSVSHELRTPLASILGAATVLTQTPRVSEDNRLSSLANVVREEAVRLDSDIQNLLDATRISSNGVKTRLEWADPGDIINAAIERRRHRLSNHVLQLNVSPDLPLIRVDPVLVEQAFGQILDNAIKYSPYGSPIRVGALSAAHEIVLSISDQGVGLTEEERNRLWDRFYRGERHRQTTPGSGLGLWIAKAFVTANGGELKAVSSGIGSGTTISIVLPAQEEVTSEPTDASHE